MAFCKVCACGEKVVFERRLSYPENCPSCGRKLSEFRTYTEDDPLVLELTAKKSDSSIADSSTQPNVICGYAEHEKKYILRLFNGKEINIPDEGCIIGRTENGAEELAEFPSVSRQHIRVTVKRIGVFLEDLSKYGTLVDGSRLIKNSPVRISIGSKITLCNVDAVFDVKEGE